ncbi:hypothetical protein AK812_SmicGene33617 [Symbiodinium microadriaticum]|uniref:Uncharacterized protein n=1 Tax=Symbiodinium microadriaticum TaxID=2951 RepID=A0A1Q9CR41_SYMMI|nr:hypothetical protein AK812_SmicGene33617 [Symbiodinium microadriaticum]
MMEHVPLVLPGVIALLSISLRIRSKKWCAFGFTGCTLCGRLRSGVRVAVVEVQWGRRGLLLRLRLWRTGGISSAAAGVPVGFGVAAAAGSSGGAGSVAWEEAPPAKLASVLVLPHDASNPAKLIQHCGLEVPPLGSLCFIKREQTAALSASAEKQAH